MIRLAVSHVAAEARRSATAVFGLALALILTAQIILPGGARLLAMLGKELLK